MAAPSVKVLFSNFPRAGQPEQRSEWMTNSAVVVPSSPKDVCPLLLGDAIPTVTLRTPAGEGFDLNSAVKQRATVLVFYRGGW